MMNDNINSDVITKDVVRTFALSFVVSFGICFAFSGQGSELGAIMTFFILWFAWDPINILFILLLYLLKIYKPLLLNFKLTVVEVLLFHGLVFLMPKPVGVLEYV